MTTKSLRRVICLQGLSHWEFGLGLQSTIRGQVASKDDIIGVINVV